MRLLGEEFARLLFSPDDHDNLAEALKVAGDSRPPRLELQFEDDVIRDAIGDLPWEYLALHCPSGVPELRYSADVLRSPRLPVERLVETPPTKHAVLPAPQQVVLFSSLESTGAPGADPQRHILTVNATDQLHRLPIQTDVVTPASWPEFLGHSAPASLVILQAPLRWADHELTIGFSPKQAGQEPRFVDFEAVLDVLKRRRAMIWLVIESIADRREWQSPNAGANWPSDSPRSSISLPWPCAIPGPFPVVYRTTRTPTPSSPGWSMSFIDGTPLDRAAHVARCEVLNTLAPKEAAVVGIPRVLQPYQREAPSATRVPKTALGSRNPEPR